MKVQEPEITPEIIQQHGITESEYQTAIEILGREPNFTELGVFSVMWSEHCSYKNTRPLLKEFPTRSDKILIAAGEENAGVLDIGDGLCVVFKIESHNHPSAVEPFQGAATGVGGIIRDIFTMGARPVCAMNSLRFGSLELAEVRRLFRGVVAGIGHYGNCFGIPTVGGEVSFDDSYAGNPLVNAFCLGVCRHDQVARGSAKGVGNAVIYVGPPTGRDGLAGAAFASQDLTEESSEQQRGAVQVGDPFMEKLVLEACLEALEAGVVVGIQDMGAAGLTCSTCETAARAGTGIDIELDLVPQRAPNMSPYEILLSESQERMLMVVEPGKVVEVQRIFEKWDLPWARIGAVTDTGQMVVRQGGEIVVDIPAAKLADQAPVYHRESREPAYFAETRAVGLAEIEDTENPVADLERLMGDPTIASKHWVYRQYDYTVRNGTVVAPGSDAAVIRIKNDSLPGYSERSSASETPIEKYLAMTADGNGVYTALDPYVGGKICVTESARNLACVGGTPIGVTDNLNFANPTNPEIFYQIREAIRGISEACRVFDAPVTGGNVSLYNQNPKGPIDPTPVVAMVGTTESVENIPTSHFREVGDSVLLLSVFHGEDPWRGMGGSRHWLTNRGRKVGRTPACDPARELPLHDALRRLIRAGVLRSAHDVSDGGLSVAVAECCVSGTRGRNAPIWIGADIRLPADSGSRLDVAWFGESQGRVVVSCDSAHEEEVVRVAENLGISCLRLGVTQESPTLTIRTENRQDSAALDRLWNQWSGAISRYMD